MSSQNPGSTDTIGTTANLVAAYVCNNSVPASELPALIASIHRAVTGLGNGTVAAQATEEVAKPTAGSVRRSVAHDGIVSFIDGKSYKTLKRHLTSHGMTPQQYRERYGLPADYPMVAPAYAAKRSELARAIGLGQVGTKQTKPEPEKKAAPRKRAA